MKKFLMTAALVFTGIQADAAVLDYYGRSYWMASYSDFKYIGGTRNDGLHVRLVIDETITGPLTDITLTGSSGSPAAWLLSAEANRGSSDTYSPNAGPLIQTSDLNFDLTFDSLGNIVDWYMSSGFPGTVGWSSSPGGDGFSDDATGRSGSFGASFGPGAWNDPSPIPLPASAILLLTAIGAAGAMARRHRD